MASDCSNETLQDLVRRCRETGLRRTVLLEKVLALLLERSEPIATQEIQNHPTVRDACDPASLYRLLSRLEEHALVRKVGLHERAAHYILNSPGRHHDYVVCVDCGRMRTLELECPVEPLEKEVSRTTGFSGIYHELQFYGHCPQCN